MKRKAFIPLVAFLCLLFGCKTEMEDKNLLSLNEESSINEIEEQYSEIKGLINSPVVKNHELYDYLNDQMEIIDSLITGIKRDQLFPELLFDFEILLQKRECIQLLLSFQKELELIEANNRFEENGYYEINVKSMGARGDGTGNDKDAIMSAILKARLSEKPARIIFPQGTYAIEGPVDENDHSNLTIADLENCVFEGSGSGSTLLMKTYGTGLNIIRSSNLKFRNLKIDYDPLPFTQGKIISIDRENDRVEIKIDNGMPDPENEKFRTARYLRGTMNHPESGRMMYEAGDWRVAELKKLDNGNIRLELLTNEGYERKGLSQNLRVGYYFVLHAREAPHGGTSIMINGSSHILFSEVSVYASPEHIATLMYSDAVKFINFIAEPKPGTGRLTCANADGFHCRSNRKGPYIKDSRLFRINDDDANIFGKMFPVSKVVNPQEYILNTQSFDFVEGKFYCPVYAPGDLVGFISVNGKFKMEGFAFIESVDKAEWKGEDWIKIRLDRPVEGIISRDTLGKPPYVSREYVNERKEFTEHFLANFDTKGNGFVIKNNSFGDHRASSIKIQSTNGIIEGNRIESVKGQGFFFGALMNWLELYPPRNIIIRNNKIINHKGFAVVVTSPTTTSPDEIMPLRRIYIYENEFRNASEHGLRINNSRDIHIYNNIIESKNPFVIDSSLEDIRINNNTIINSDDDEK